MIISKKKYEEELAKAHDRGVHETEERFWRNHQERETNETIAKLIERVSALENKGKKPKFRCPHLGAITFRG